MGASFYANSLLPLFQHSTMMLSFPLLDWPRRDIPNSIDSAFQPHLNIMNTMKVFLTSILLIISSPTHPLSTTWNPSSAFELTLVFLPLLHWNCWPSKVITVNRFFWFWQSSCLLLVWWNLLTCYYGTPDPNYDKSGGLVWKPLCYLA